MRYGDNDDEVAPEDMVAHNASVSDLRIGMNLLSEFSCESLTTFIKNNGVITRLDLDVCDEFAPRDYKDFFNACRLYNTSLEDINVCNTPLTVKTAQAIFRVCSNDETRIRKINMSKCNVKHLHLKNLNDHLR